MFGGGWKNDIVWHYGLGAFKTRSHYPRKHDTILFYAKGRNPTFNLLRGEPTPAMLAKYRHRDDAGHRYMRSYGRRYYLKGGKPFDSVWEIPSLSPRAAERTGYPTQKSVKLLKRIVQASSNPGDLVLDPFCGCGTTIEAAHGLDRQWIGIDICVKACQVIEERLRRSFDMEWSDIQFRGMPKTRDHAAKLAAIDPFQFERWAASLTPWMEWNKQPVADKGIDGVGRFPLKKGVFAKMVAQVKGGHTQPKDIQAFNGARQQARADMGVFTCFEGRVTQGMRDAAASTGRFKDAPVIQIYTVEDYFAGRLPQMPRAA